MKGSLGGVQSDWSGAGERLWVERLENKSGAVIKIHSSGVPVVHGSAETTPTRIHEDAGSIPGLSIQRCRERWCKSQMQLGSHISVAVV